MNCVTWQHHLDAAPQKPHTQAMGLGRRSKIDEVVEDARGQPMTRGEIVVRALQNGQTRKTAARLAGVPEGTLYQWFLKGEQQRSGRYHDFREETAKALTVAEARLVTSVYKSVEGGVFSVATYDTHGRVVMGPDGKPKTKQVLVPPDGRLALKLLQIRNPATWGPGNNGKADDLQELDGRPPANTEPIGDIFKSALDLLLEKGVVPEGLAPLASAATIEVEPGRPVVIEEESAPSQGEVIVDVAPAPTSAPRLAAPGRSRKRR